MVDYRSIKHVRELFTQEEWDKLCDYEQTVYHNQLQFFQTKLRLGLKANKTPFMLDYEKRLENELQAKRREEEVQAQEKKRQTEQKMEKTVGSKKKKVAFVAPAVQNTTDASKAGPATSGEANTDRERGPYSMRKVKKVYYHKFFDDPDNDLLIPCDTCNNDYRDGLCPVHGSMTWVANATLPKGEHNRAEKTLPDCFRLTASEIQGAGRGVLAMENIPERTVFGPYEGEIKSVSEGDYCWMIKVVGEPPKYVDGSDLSQANWMRFVNCARFREEQNLAAFQYNGRLYYRTTKLVEKFTELLVWYGDGYARELGIDIPARAPREFAPDLPPGTAYTPSKIFKCRDCDSEFTVSDVYMKHRRSAHGVQVGFSVTSQVEHKEDGSVENDLPMKERRFVCEICKSNFSRKRSLKIHERIHTGEKPYECDKCQKKFTQLAHFLGHQRIHTGEKPFKCQVCDKSFNHSHTRNRHIRTVHTKLHPHRCNFCSKRFTRKETLSQHVDTVHLLKKSFRCESCGKAFGQKGNLNQHIESVHLELKPFECSDCGKMFSQKSHLYFHRKTLHKST